MRVPGWAPGVSATLNGKPAPSEPGTDQYLRVRRSWEPGDELTVEFPLPVRTIHPDPRIDAVRSCVAFERGPLVYCFEGMDVPGGDGLRGVSLPAAAKPSERHGLDVAGQSVTALSVPGQASATQRRGWPYSPQAPADGAAGPSTPVELTAIPYYARANRGDTDMRVWVPTGGVNRAP